jgi:hypothetical protein
MQIQSGRTVPLMRLSTNALNAIFTETTSNSISKLLFSPSSEVAYSDRIDGVVKPDPKFACLGLFKVQIAVCTVNYATVQLDAFPVRCSLAFRNKEPDKGAE